MIFIFAYEILLKIYNLNLLSKLIDNTIDNTIEKLENITLNEIIIHKYNSITSKKLETIIEEEPQNKNIDLDKYMNYKKINDIDLIV